MHRCLCSSDGGAIHTKQSVTALAQQADIQLHHRHHVALHLEPSQGLNLTCCGCCYGCFSQAARATTPHAAHKQHTRTHELYNNSHRSFNAGRAAPQVSSLAQKGSGSTPPRHYAHTHIQTLRVCVCSNLQQQHHHHHPRSVKTHLCHMSMLKINQCRATLWAALTTAAADALRARINYIQELPYNAHTPTHPMQLCLCLCCCR